MAFNVFIYNHWPWADIQGLVIGHIFYFLEDVYPRMPNSGGRRLLEAPRFLKNLFQTRDRANAALANQGAREDAVPQEVPRDGRNPVEDTDGNLRQRTTQSGTE